MGQTTILFEKQYISEDNSDFEMHIHYYLTYRKMILRHTNEHDVTT